MSLVSTTVERLFGLASELDEEYELEWDESTPKDSKTFKDEVGWLVQSLKIQEWLRVRHRFIKSSF